MTPRPSLLAACALVLGIVGCSPEVTITLNSEQAPAGATSNSNITGYYVHDDPAFYHEKDMKNVAPERVMHLGIEKGRWLMHNASTAYGGTWVQNKDGATLTVTSGPDGTTSIARRTAMGITLSSRGNGPLMKLTYISNVAPPDFGYDKFLGPAK